MQLTAQPPPLVPGQPVPKAHRIFGLPAPVAIKVAIPIAGGLLAAFAAVYSLRPGKERWATVFIASWALLTAATGAAEALQRATEEYGG